MRNIVALIVLLILISCSQTREEEYWDYNPLADTSEVDSSAPEIIRDSIDEESNLE